MSPVNYTTIDFLEELERVRHVRWRNTAIAVVVGLIIFGVVLYLLARFVL